jgi:MSHA biogenesis protein MshL
MQGNQYFFKLIVLTVCFLLTSCKTIHATHGTVNDKIHYDLQQGVAYDHGMPIATVQHRKVPTSVSNALIPSVSRRYATENTFSERRFNVTADKMPAKTFFTGLVEGTSINMVVNPNVTGNISLNLKNVTIEEAMQAVRDAYGYEYKRTSYGYEVLPQELETTMFTVNYLDVKRTGKSLTQVSSGQISDKVGTFSTGSGSNSQSPFPQQNASQNPPSGSSIDTRSEMNFWHDLEITLKTMIGTDVGRSVVVNPQAGLVIVHALPKELHQVGRYLSRIQLSMGRQVILEAKILEVELNDQFQSGVNWNLFGLGNATTNDGGVSQSATNTFVGTSMADFNTMFTLNAGKGSFNLLIKLLQTQGNVQVLSSPRLSTVNNQKAVIKVGKDEFFVTGVSTENTVTANSTIPTQNVSLTPFFSGITFDVTPQISKNNEIILHIHPSVSLVKQQEKTIQLGQTAVNTPNTLTLPLALSTIRESDNVVRAKNGQIIVIGGLMQNTMVEETAGTPGLSRIPFFGALFRRTAQVSTKNELVILLRPIIATQDAWVNDLEETDRNFASVRRGNHQGGLADVFGNEGEIEGWCGDSPCT